MAQPSTNTTTTTAPTVRMTFQFTLQPTPAQDRPWLRTCGVGAYSPIQPWPQRLTWWRRVQGKSVTRFRQAAELQEMCVAFPEYAVLHRHILKDLLARLDKASQ